MVFVGIVPSKAVKKNFRSDYFIKGLFRSLIQTFERDINKKHAANNNPCNVAWRSLNLIPSKYRTDWVYAKIKAFKANILNICKVVTKVHLPCLII